MEVLKHGKSIYGANLNSAERRALDIEVRRQIAEYDRKNSMEIDAIFLWQLHEQCGFGPQRLRKFFDGFRPAINALMDRYELSGTDDEIWLQTQQLKDIGVDLEQWYKESGL